MLVFAVLVVVMVVVVTVTVFGRRTTLVSVVLDVARRGSYPTAR